MSTEGKLGRIQRGARCPGRRPLCLLCFPQDEPPDYHFPWRFFWSPHMMFSGSKVCPPELHINRTIRHWSEAKAGVLLNHLFFFLQLHLLQDLFHLLLLLYRIYNSFNFSLLRVVLLATTIARAAANPQASGMLGLCPHWTCAPSPSLSPASNAPAVEVI